MKGILRRHEPFSDYTLDHPYFRFYHFRRILARTILGRDMIKPEVSVGITNRPT